MNPFAPEFEGEMTFEALPGDVIDRVRERVESGLLQAGRRDRADYRVISSDRDSIRFEAHGLPTAYNVGLNDVTVRRLGRNQLRYQVTYWRWTLTAVGHGLAMGLLFAGLYLLAPLVRDAVHAQAHGPVFFGSIVGFWCLVWPWLLSFFHRRFAARCLERILREIIAKGSARAA